MNETKNVHGDLILLARVVLAELVPDGAKLLAVAAPWCIKLGKDIFGIVKDNFIKLASDQSNDGAVVGFRNGFRLEQGLESAIEETVDKSLDRSDSNVDALVVRVLERVGHVLDDERGPLGFHDVECLGVLGELDSIDPDKVDLALVLLCDGGNLSNLGLLVRVGGIEEEVGKRKTGLGIVGIVLAANLVEERNSVLLDKGIDRLGGGGLDISKFIAALIEFLKASQSGYYDETYSTDLVKDKSGSSDTSLLDCSRVSGYTEEVVITMIFSNSSNALGECIIGRVDICNDDNLVLLDERSMRICSNFAESGKSLLLHIANNSIGLARTSVVLVLAIAEHLEGPTQNSKSTR